MEFIMASRNKFGMKSELFQRRATSRSSERKTCNCFSQKLSAFTQKIVIESTYNNGQAGLLLHFSQVPFDIIPMKSHILAARVGTAFSAFHVVCGIERSTGFAGKMLYHLNIPFFIANILDSLMRFPKFNSVRCQRLKGPEVVAGIIPTGSTEVHAFGLGAFDHHTHCFAKETARTRPATVTLQFLNGFLIPARQCHQPLMILLVCNEHMACRTKQTTHCGKLFIRPTDVFDR
jgi:hypothetical protein